MIAATESEGGDTAKQHLHPASKGHDLANHAVTSDDVASYARVYALCEVEFEVYAQYDLKKEHEH